MTDHSWISVYARSPREGVLLDVKLSDGSVRTMRTVRYLEYSPHIWRTVEINSCCPAWNTTCYSCANRVTHFRGHDATSTKTWHFDGSEWEPCS